MKRRTETSESTRKAIVNMKEAGMKGATIARILKIPERTVSSILSRFRERGTVTNKPRSGRPRLTSIRQDRRIVRLSLADPSLTCVDIAAKFNASNGNISRRTVGRRLSAVGLNGRRPAKKPLIRFKNRKARVEFACRHLHWTSSDWSKVLFSGESKFNLFGSDGIKYVRRPSVERFNPRYIKATVKHNGGSVMVSGAFSLNGMALSSEFTEKND
ncbi:transposase [Teladorsagia circumcincta]|uniref:Transposase n=1 Tax=Teladorsagia circumcincta TaxID=45464 RepID=A0A2G9T8F2_TELCI|nr:transposase [Teladorsagia circumcincta]